MVCTLYGIRIDICADVQIHFLFSFICCLYYIVFVLFSSSINPVEDICNFRLTDPFLSHSLKFSFIFFTFFTIFICCVQAVMCTRICVNYISCIRIMQRAFAIFHNCRMNSYIHVYNICISISICLPHTYITSIFKDVNPISSCTSHSFFYTTSHTNCLENECRFLCFYIQTVQYKCYCSSTLLHIVLSLYFSSFAPQHTHTHTHTKIKKLKDRRR